MCPRGSGARTLLSSFEDGSDNLIDAERFEEDTKDSEPFSEHVDRRVPEPRHEKRGRHDRKLPHGTQHAEARATCHAYIEDDYVRSNLTAVSRAGEQPEGRRAVARLPYIVAPIDQGFPECAAEGVVVISQKDRCSGGRFRAVFGSRRRGPGRVPRRGPDDEVPKGSSHAAIRRARRSFRRLASIAGPRGRAA
jgi:hypothetical protein